MGSDTHHGRMRIYGHRGSRRKALENSMDAFDIAMHEGSDGFETDVRRLIDGTLVLFHDDEIGGAPIETFTLTELKTAWPGLAVLDEIRLLEQHPEVILEVKRHGYAADLVDAVGRMGLDRVVIASFDHRLVRDLAVLRKQKDVKFGLGLTIAGRPIGAAEYARALGAEWYFPAHSFVDRELVEELNAGGIKVVPWTPNSLEYWDYFREWGCHGVITDVPDEAVAWRETSA